ncbi:DNA-binding helix-turn-helix protein [uncultured Eubacteriales bacterium]|uniref:DNA-binding helix-turn-helix protein n=1 Tax=uncultured Eubacteriales bacterium TaxID=172733 RepID=A0A212KLP5_9FIRM|nr:DNA-binding helix-turn-helix protein [uncultured Eubacteriales bacterium]
MLEKDEFNREFGRRVKLARKAAKLKGEKAAEDAGITPQFLSDVECGKKGVSNYNVARLALALHVSADYLLFGRSDGNEERDMVAERLAALPPAIREMAEEVLGYTLDIIQGNIPR